MPAKSGKQYRYMAGIAHGMKPYTKGGPSQSVAEEIVHKTPPAKRKQFMRKNNG
jgi:hypothetical protein